MFYSLFNWNKTCADDAPRLQPLWWFLRITAFLQKLLIVARSIISRFPSKSIPSFRWRCCLCCCCCCHRCYRRCCCCYYCCWWCRRRLCCYCCLCQCYRWHSWRCRCLCHFHFHFHCLSHCCCCRHHCCCWWWCCRPHCCCFCHRCCCWWRQWCCCCRCCRQHDWQLLFPHYRLFLIGSQSPSKWETLLDGLPPKMDDLSYLGYDRGSTWRTEISLEFNLFPSSGIDAQENMS